LLSFFHSAAADRRAKGWKTAFAAAVGVGGNRLFALPSAP
jgi:hypothetical protein